MGDLSNAEPVTMNVKMKSIRIGKQDLKPTNIPRHTSLGISRGMQPPSKNLLKTEEVSSSTASN